MLRRRSRRRSPVRVPPRSGGIFRVAKNYEDREILILNFGPSLFREAKKINLRSKFIRGPRTSRLSNPSHEGLCSQIFQQKNLRSQNFRRNFAPRLFAEWQKARVLLYQRKISLEIFRPEILHQQNFGSRQNFPKENSENFSGGKILTAMAPANQSRPTCWPLAKFSSENFAPRLFAVWQKARVSPTANFS